MRGLAPALRRGANRFRFAKRRPFDLLDHGTFVPLICGHAEIGRANLRISCGE